MSDILGFCRLQRDGTKQCASRFNEEVQRKHAKPCVLVTVISRARHADGQASDFEAFLTPQLVTLSQSLSWTMLLLSLTPHAASQAMYSRSICKSSVTFWRLRWYFWVPAGMFVQAGNGFVLKMCNGVSMTLLLSMFSAVSPPTSANLFEPPLLRLLTVRSYSY